MTSPAPACTVSVGSSALGPPSCISVQTPHFPFLSAIFAPQEPGVPQTASRGFSVRRHGKFRAESKYSFFVVFPPYLDCDRPLVDALSLRMPAPGARAFAAFALKSVAPRSSLICFRLRRRAVHGDHRTSSQAPSASQALHRLTGSAMALGRSWRTACFGHPCVPRLPPTRPPPNQQK